MIIALCLFIIVLAIANCSLNNDIYREKKFKTNIGTIKVYYDDLAPGYVLETTDEVYIEENRE